MTEEKNDGFKEITGVNIWLPDAVGDMLQGVVVGIDTGDYGTQLIVETEKDVFIKTPSHIVLQTRLTNINKGDQIRILYEGEDAPKIKGHNPTKLYRVYKK